MSHDVFGSLSRFVVATAMVVTAAFCVVPLFVVATGSYTTLPLGVGATSRLLLLFLPQAAAIALPITVAAAVFFVCRRLPPVTRQVCITVGTFIVAATVVTAALNVLVAPATNAMYRQLAFGDADGRSVNGRRLNAPGEPGDRFRMEHRWALPEAVLVLAALAFAASRAISEREC